MAAVRMGSYCFRGRSYLTSSNRMPGSYQTVQKNAALGVQGMRQTITGGWQKGQDRAANVSPDGSDTQAGLT